MRSSYSVSALKQIEPCNLIDLRARYAGLVAWEQSGLSTVGKDEL